jgi:hypothetical protein
VIWQTGGFHLTRLSVNRLLSVVVLALAPAVALRAPRSMSGTTSAVAVSHMMVAKVRRKHGLRPHRRERYMASNDPDFEKKAVDIVGLYLNPPAHAAVFSVQL